MDASYGPRKATRGTFFHKGLDLNQQGTGGATANNDLNLPIVASANGGIFGIGRTSDGIYWIGVDYANARSFAYLHVFPSKYTLSGNFRVLVDNAIARNNEIKSYKRIVPKTEDSIDDQNLGIVLYYSDSDNKGRVVKVLGVEDIYPARVQISPNDHQDVAVSTEVVYPEGASVVSGGTDGVLETMPAGDDVYSYDKTRILVGPNRKAETTAGYVTISTSVLAGEIIAPLGASGADNAHLHLQVSNPDPVLSSLN